MKSEKEKMLSGEFFNSSDNQLAIDRARARKLMFEFNSSRPDEEERKQQAMTQLINAKGNFCIEPPFYCDYGYNIEVGEEFYANFGCAILDGNKVQIGDNVLLAPNVQIYTASHPVNAEKRKQKLNGFTKSVIIGDNVWVGGGAIICPGVKIGNNVTIGAGSVVTRDIPDNVLAVGNPCRVVREI